MIKPELRFVNVELVQKQLLEAQQAIEMLKAKINDVPPEKILKYVLIGTVIGLSIYGIHDYNAKRKK
jgi:hypothetical protein